MEIGFGSMLDDLINRMREYALENNVPIMTEGGINYLMKLLCLSTFTKSFGSLSTPNVLTSVSTAV